MKCPKCGMENNDNAASCSSCGTILKSTTKAPDLKAQEKNIVNPNVIEKTTIQSKDDNLFGSQEQFTLRSSQTHNDVLNTNKKIASIEEVTVDTGKPIEVPPVIAPKEEQEEKKPKKDIKLPAIKELINPISDPNDEVLDDHISILVLIRLMLGAFIKPGTTIKENTRAYTKMSPSVRIYAFFSGITLIAFMITNVINGCFVKVYDINIDSYTSNFDIAALQTVDFISIALIGILLTFGVTLLFSLGYYIASFFTNKGLSFGRYLSVITLSLIPFYIGTCIIGPLIGIFSSKVDIIINLFGIVYSFIILIVTLNDMLTFKDTNQKILYHTIILGIVFTIIGFVISIYLKETLNLINIKF